MLPFSVVSTISTLNFCTSEVFAGRATKRLNQLDSFSLKDGAMQLLCLELGGNNLVYIDKCQQQCWEFLSTVSFSSLNTEEEIYRYIKQIHCF